MNLSQAFILLVKFRDFYLFGGTFNAFVRDTVSVHLNIGHPWWSNFLVCCFGILSLMVACFLGSLVFHHAHTFG